MTTLQTTEKRPVSTNNRQGIPFDLELSRKIDMLLEREEQISYSLPRSPRKRRELKKIRKERRLLERGISS